MAIDIKSLAIIGCGWLGFPLSQILIDKGYTVKGSTRSVSKQQELINSGVDAYLLDIYKVDRSIDEKLGQVDAAIINIPPGRRREEVESLYPSSIERLIKKCPGLSEAYVVFVSSTGVYGNSYNLVDETAPVGSDRASSQALVSAEEVVEKSCPNHVILRMSGLVGPSREPGRWFAGKYDIPGGDTPVNMVHLTDCLSIIQLILKRQPSQKVYNVTAPMHPKKRDFYNAQSKKIGVTPPRFLEGVLPHKIINHEKLVKDHGYQYEYPDPLFF